MLCVPFLTKAGDIATGKSNGNTPAILQSCPTFTITTKRTNVSCYGGNNGAATVSTVTGGTSPYTYSWAPYGGTGDTATGLTAGT